MGTRISNEVYGGGGGCDNRVNLIGFCKQSPKEVLKQVFRTYYIIKYEGLYRPVDYNYPNNAQGLHIENSDEPSGTRITGSLKSLDLSVALAKLEHPRSEEIFERALSASIDWYLVSKSSGSNYFNIREQKKDEKKEEIIRRLKEVANVTLDLKRPTINDLKRIHEKYHTQK